MGPTWGGQDPGGSHVGHLNLAIWVILFTVHLTIEDNEYVLADHMKFSKMDKKIQK